MKIRRLVFSVTLFMLAPVIMQAQVAPANTGGGDFRLALGAGFSPFKTDYAPQWSYGVSAYGDLDFRSRLGVEVEGRTVQWNNGSNLREDTIGGGPRVRIAHIGRFVPYAKLIAGIGSIDFPPNPKAPHYTHDTFFLWALGGGSDYKLTPHIYLRGEFQYQWWPGWTPHGLSPHGFTIGANYRF